MVEVVLGDNGLFKGAGGSRTARWVTITECVTGVLEKIIDPEGLRKHVELLAKKHRKKMTKESGMLGQLSM